MCNEEENEMAVAQTETSMKINPFSIMRDIITSEMKAQGLTEEDIRKEISLKRNDK